MAHIAHFRELRVWQAAMDAAMDIYEASKRFPPEERYSLTDQIRRSSRSVPSNIAEAWHKRRYPAAFVSKLSDAEGEAAETETWIEFARRCNYLHADKADELGKRYEHIISQIVIMIEHPEQWVIRKPEPTSTSQSLSPRRPVSPSPRRQ
ncbi:MAG: four helix bundle protein [Phycisphaerae bacterium]|nr:four helix bundle protein [Phycisphaerae bacterium]